VLKKEETKKINVKQIIEQPNFFTYVALLFWQEQMEVLFFQVYQVVLQSYKVNYCFGFDLRKREKKICLDF